MASCLHRYKTREASTGEEIGAAASDGTSRVVSSAEPSPSRAADLDLGNTAALRRQSDAATAQVAKLQRGRSAECVPDRGQRERKPIGRRGFAGSAIKSRIASNTILNCASYFFKGR
jgi:hypothetical protein